ncbi:MAG: NF038122 family metalloprotease, partial [Cyanobacteria bacterium P01_D01_bin.44]
MCSLKIQKFNNGRIRYACLLGLLGIPAALLPTTPAQAANFRFTYGPNTTLEQMVGFEIAGGIWSSYLKDDVTLNLYVETTNILPSGTVGAALPGLEPEYDYEKLVEAFNADITSQADASAYGGLPAKDFRFGYQGNKDDNDFIEKVKELNLTRANAKALGIIDVAKEDKKAAKEKEKYDKEYAKYEACLQKQDNCDGEKKKYEDAYDKYKKSWKLDGVILMSDLSNTSASWNYDAVGSIAGNQLDFVAVSLHEIGHNLGFISGIDDPGFISVVTEQQTEGKEIKGDKLKFSTNLDLFRYSATSAVEGIPDLTFSNEEKYFSLDGGSTKLGVFSLGNGLGDFQASHWKQQANSLGIMQPLLKPGKREQITNLDLLAFDTLGWDLSGGGNFNVSVLERQAKEKLAQSLGISVEFLEANPTVVESLQENRDKEIDKLLQESKRYDRRRSSRSSRSGFRQESWRTFYAQEAYLSTVTLPDKDTASVPEP